MGPLFATTELLSVLASFCQTPDGELRERQSKVVEKVTVDMRDHETALVIDVSKLWDQVAKNEKL